MKYRTFIIRSVGIYLVLVVLLSGALPAVTPIVPVVAQEAPLHGDITGDGVVDGRDALKIMRVVEGHETATAEELARGDVYPLPGTGGRLVGDGQLTRADAEKILRSSVGLVSLGEITGDYSASWPVVERFEPAGGRAGTQITVYGANFIAGSPGENIVYIGETLAPVQSSSGTQLQVTVPQGATTGRVRVITPAGEASSALDFHVMRERTGQLVPPAGLNPRDFTVANSFGDQAHPGADGAFTIPTDSYGVTMQMALPKTAGDERVLMQMDLFGGQALAAQAIADDPAVMDLLTTAQGMVFLSPYLASADVVFAEATMAVIADDPQVQALAALLAQLYRETDEPLDDPRFDEAYLRAVESALNRLPAGMVIDLGSPQGHGVGGESIVSPPQSVLDLFGTRDAGDVQFFYLASQSPDAAAASDWRWQAWYPENDFTYTTAKAGVQPGQIVPRVEKGNPADWIVQLAEVNDIYNVFPAGKQSLAGMDPRQALPRGAYHSLSGARADSTLQYINLFGLGFNAAWSALGEAVTSAAPGLQGSLTPALQVDPDRDAVYVVRAYSGMLGSGADAGEFDFVYDAVPNGRMAYLVALGQNAVWAAIDMISVAINMKGSADKAMLENAIQKGIERAIARSPRALSPAVGAQVFLTVANQVVKDALSAFAASVVGVGITKATLKIIGKSLNPLTVLYRISTGAQGVERLASLIGFNYRMSPLETWVIVVGDPYTPRLEQVSPENPAPGDEIVLRGRNFDYRSASNNEVRVGDWWPSATPAAVISVSQDGTALRFKLPDDAPPGATSVWVKVPFRVTPIMFEDVLKVRRRPQLTEMTPLEGYGPASADNEQYHNFGGTTVVLSGRNLRPAEGENPTQPDEVRFGDKVATTIANWTDTYIEVKAPQLPPGPIEVYIRSPHNGTESQHLTFTVLDKPLLTSVAPVSAKPGYLLTLQGGNFKENWTTVTVRGASGGGIALIRDVQPDRMVVQMPTVGQPGDPLNVQVWTPAGSSGARAIVREAGLATPVPPACPDEGEIPLGYRILVNEAAGGHKLSFDDANAFINGADPFAPPYDDLDAVYEWVWQENAQCQYETKPQSTRGPFSSYHKGQYNYDFDGSRGHTGTEREIIMRVNVLRPDCHGGQGGETAPVLLIDGSHDAPETGWDEEGKCDEKYVAEDCPEEGDFVGYRTAVQNGGRGYADLVEFDPGVASYQGSSFQPDDGDTLTGRGNLILSGNITIQSFNQVRASGIERVGGIVIVGDGTTKGALNHVTVGIVGSGGIKLTNALCNDVEATEVRGGAVGVEINRGGRNLVEVLGPVSAGSDGVRIVNSVSNAVGTGWNESPGGHGVLIEGGGRNTFVGGVRSSGQTAVYLNETIDSSAGAQVEKAGGRGFEIVGGGLNSVGGSVDGASGDGVRVSNSSENEIDVTVTNCGSYGIVLPNLWDHTISGGATGCAQSGLYIEGGGEHEIARFAANANSGHGIELNNTMHNTLSHITAAGNGGNGLHLRNGASFTAFTAFAGDEGEGIWDNQNGIVIEGPTTSHNEVGNAGVRFRMPEADEYPGNNQNGIVIQDGAHHNTVYGAYGNQQNGMVLLGGAHHNTLQAGVVGNGQHGILVEEAHDNTITAGQVSSNGGDGVHIGAQAANTTVWGDAGIYGNGANGIAVLGTGTVIRGSYGLQIGQTSRTTPRPNQGFGIFVDGATDTTIISVEVGRNGAGGIRVQNVNRPTAAADPLITISNVHVGYEKIYPDHQPPYYQGIDGLPGQGVDFENCTDVRYAADVYGHQVGLHIGGLAPVPSRFNLRSGSVVSSTEIGIELLHLQDSDVNLYAAHNGGNGISLFDSRDVRFIGNQHPTSIDDLSANQNGGSGISVERSENITIGYAGRGFSSNQAHGIHIGPQSRHIALLGVRAFDNGGSGVYIKQAGDVELSPAGGDPLGSGSRFRDNAEAGIKIEDAQSVQLIAFADDANDIGPGNGVGVDVRGQESTDIVVSGWYIHDNTETGIRVADATDVLIGGFGEDEGNSIGANKNGIVAAGAGAQVVIANNHIWRNGELALAAGADGQQAGPLQLAGIGVALHSQISGVTLVGNTIEHNAAEGVWLGGASKTLLRGNSVEHNDDGVVIEGAFLAAANANQLSNNVIRSNQSAGVVVAGDAAGYNTISRNVITQNGGKGIALESGGNAGIAAPVITRLSHRGANIEGTSTAPDGSIVEVFADLSDEGAIFLGQATVRDGQFNLTTEVPPGMALHATVTDPSGNTSEFGPTNLSGPPLADYVFTSTRDGNEEIYLMGSGLTSARRLTARPAADDSPRLCKNGDEVVFASDALGSRDIWWVNSDGTGLEQLTKDVGAEFDPACSPAGDQFAYSDGRDILVAGLGSGGSPQEIAYDDGGAEFAYGAAAGQAYGVHFTRPAAAQGTNDAPQALAAIRFWIDADPAEFQWQIYDWVNNQPGPKLAEGRTTPQTTGWHTAPLAGVEVGEDFLVSIRYTQNERPQLGFDFRQQASTRSWVDSGGGWWQPPGLTDFIMIRASFAAGPQRLTDDTFADRQPDWCADGKRIAFTSDRSGNDDIWVIDSDGTDLRQVTTNPAADHSPAWSPDCSQLAFVSERDGNPEIYRIDPGGATSTRLTDHPAADTDPAWLPDGLKLLFVSDRDAGQEIYAMNASGGALERLTNSLGDNTQPDAGAARARTQTVGLAALSGSAGPLQVALPAVSIQPGEAFTVPVTLAAAQNLGHLAFELAYPAGNLTLLRIVPGSLLGGGLYAVNPETIAVQDGRIRFGWVRASGFAGGGELLQLVFRAEPLAYGAWPLAFANPGAFDVTLTVLEVNVADGQVEVPWPPTPTPTVTPTPTITPTPTVTPTPAVRKMWLPLMDQS